MKIGNLLGHHYLFLSWGFDVCQKGCTVSLTHLHDFFMRRAYHGHTGGHSTPETMACHYAPLFAS